MAEIRFFSQGSDYLGDSLSDSVSDRGYIFPSEYQNHLWIETANDSLNQSHHHSLSLSKNHILINPQN